MALREFEELQELVSSVDKKAMYITICKNIKKFRVERYEEFKKQNIQSKLVLQIHDELIIDCLATEVDKVRDIVKNVMENVIKLSVPLKVSIAIGKDLYEAK